MIIFDGVHLCSTIGEEELHTFAQTIGLKREWFQETSKSGAVSRHSHYDIISKRVRARAIGKGAQLVNSQDFIRMAWWSEYKARQTGNGHGAPISATVPIGLAETPMGRNQTETNPPGDDERLCTP